ncbi:Allergen V5/Tpx-1-related [Macleaya cordata]|uniref:Allergen V5/Tpx-1-related n=1 Tax=Macleaya cordata TaxID=56857 RepID=A0A200QPP4_MACCD|nr:Allergen V5/Tpx-1-related [Macleaya cordata]
MATTKIMFFLILFLFSFFLAHVESRRSLGMTQSAMITQFLTAHNKVRTKHGLPKLKWNSRLANYAKWYGNQRRGDCALIHSTANYGENIFWGKGKRWKPADAVAAWAAQEAYYNYRTNTCMANKECLHYTQLVWKNTRTFGCAQMRCKSGDTFIICEYDPHGNVMGQRPY